MAETTADVRRDIELTRERMSDTLAQLEQKLNLMQVVKDHPWPAVAIAVGAGFALAGSRADVKAAAAAVQATRGTSTRMGSLLDDLAASLITGVTVAFHDRVDGWVNELKGAIGAPDTGARSAKAAGASDRARGAASGTTSRTGAATVATGSVDRQLLGVDEGAQQGTGRQMLGVDLAAQASGVRSNPPLAD